MNTQLSFVVTPQEYQSQQHFPRWRICDLPAEERPLYHLHQYGSSGLATTELLALLLGTAEAPAAAIIVAHNHPSGQVSPSPEDVTVTRQLVKAGKLLDVAVLDRPYPHS